MSRTPQHPRLAVFSDLDGTLLDHDNYSFEAARPALAELAERGIPLVLASSKTAAEIARLHAEMGLGDAPAIVENGAGVFRPSEGTGGDNAAYRAIRAVLDGLPVDMRAPFHGFGDMTDAEVAKVTGLPADQAALARQRCHSEPGLWGGTDAALNAFLVTLSLHGITARRGGRFLTLSHGTTKADAMRRIASDLGASVTIALGDAPNDAEMLEAATYGVLVRNDHAPPMPALSGEAEGRLLRTNKSGPAGWNAAVLGLIDRIYNES